MSVSEAIENFHVPTSETQPELGQGRTKYYPSGSARTLLKECFVENPATHVDTHQQITGLNSDQLIQFARAIGLDVPLATLGMLEDLLLKISSQGRKSDGRSGEGIVQSPFFGRAGSTVAESIAFRSFYSLPTKTESVASNLIPD